MVNQYTGKTRITKEQIIEDYYGNLMTQSQIAQKYNTTNSVVEKLFKKYELKGRVPKNNNQSGSNNHQWKGGVCIDGKGYKVIKNREHPRANSRGYVKEHILIMEEYLGRSLNYYGQYDPNTEVVHHINGNRQDNRLENLMLLTNKEHWKLHYNNLNKNK